MQKDRFGDHETLNEQCYRKLVVLDDGQVMSSTLATDSLNFSHFMLRGADGRALQVLYRPKSSKVNPFWANLREKFPGKRQAAVPEMRGMFFVHAPKQHLAWNDKILLRELINYYTCKVQRKPYSFAVFSERGD